MKINLKRLLCLTLALILTAGSTLSCAQSEVNTDEEAAAASETAAEVSPEEIPEEEEELNYYQMTGAAEDTRYDGYEFTAMVANNENWDWGSICAEELTGEVLNDAFFNRNLLVESLLEVKIGQVSYPQGDLQGKFKTSVTAGDNAFEAAFPRQMDAASCAMRAMCLDLNEISPIDLQKPWWDFHSYDDLTMAGKNYIAAGEIAISDKDCIWVLYFDKEIHEANGLEDLYDLVEAGKWTQDKLLEMMEIAVKDLDGDGDIDTNDCWGLLTHSENYAASWMAAGEKIITLDADGIPFPSYDTERFVDAWNKTIKVMKSPYCKNDNIDYISSGLREGHTLFGTEVIAFLRVYRENERDFGIVPMPKYEEAQADYHTYVAENNGMMIVPKTVQDTDRAGTILEMMAATGRDIVLNAYFDVCIKTRDSRDERSGKMLDICFGTRCYDLGLMFNWGGLAAVLKTGVEDFSKVRQKEKPMKKQMKTAFEELGIETGE